MARRKPYRHLLVTVDGTAAAARTMRTTVALARALGARVHGVYLAPAPDSALYGAAALDGAPALLEALERDAGARAKKALGALQVAARRAGVPCSVDWVRGARASKAVLAVARKRRCDLVVLAARAASGGLAAHVLARSGAAILLIR